MVSQMTTNGLKKQLENWNQINWKKVSLAVRNLRQRIFRAKKLGNFRKLRSLQKLMQKSYANLLLSVLNQALDPFHRKERYGKK